MAQAAIFQLQHQERLTEAALFEKELKDQLAEQDVERMLAAGEIEASTAAALLEAKLARIASEYDQELEVIVEKEAERAEALKEIQNEEASELLAIENHKNKSLMSVKMSGAKAIAGLAKKLLGDSKAAAVAGVAIDAAMAAGEIMAQGARTAQSIVAGHALQASMVPDPTGATQTAILAKGQTMATASLASSKALAMTTAAIKFGTGVAGVAMGGSGGGGGGGGGGGSLAQNAPVQEISPQDQVITPQPINVTVDGSIDPIGARRIIEAINEATEDGLQINALVGS